MAHLPPEAIRRERDRDLDEFLALEAQQQADQTKQQRATAEWTKAVAVQRTIAEGHIRHLERWLASAEAYRKSLLPLRVGMWQGQVRLLQGAQQRNPWDRALSLVVPQYGFVQQRANAQLRQAQLAPHPTPQQQALEHELGRVERDITAFLHEKEGWEHAKLSPRSAEIDLAAQIIRQLAEVQERREVRIHYLENRVARLSGELGEANPLATRP